MSTPMEYVTSGLQDVGNVANAYRGASRGNLTGYLGAGSNTASLLGRLSGNGSLSQYGGELGSVAGILGGLQHGGWQGDTSAALNAGRLASQTGYLPSNYSGYLGYAAIPLELYNFAKYGTASGKTGSDAMTGAETGASIGSTFGPVGTVVGGVLGGAAGAIASEFGPGAEDPENMQWNQYASLYDKNPAISGYLSPQTAYTNLAGVMDARDNSAGHSQPVEQVFGRMGENNLMDQLAQEVNSAYKSGAITPGESIGQQWSQVVDPWLTSKGAGIANQNTIKGDPEGGALAGDLQSLMGAWESGQLAPQLAINGQSTGMAQFAGESPQLAQFWAQQTAPHAQLRTKMMTAARGGSMNSKLSRLRAVYESSFKDRKTDFADGGSYSSYASYDPSGLNLSLTGSGSDPYLNYSLPTSNPYSTGSAFDAYANDPSNNFSYTDPSASGSSSSGWLGALSAGGQDISSVLSALKGYAPLLPLIGALTGATTPKAASVPNLPNNSITPVATPSYSRSPIANPTNNSSKTPMTTDDWYTYGERPEASFFGNSQLPYIAGMSPASSAPQSSVQPYMGVPGRLPVDDLHLQARGGHLPVFDSVHDNYVRGEGDGTSDDIPAKLSDGEYVVDAGTVSMLGNGSNEAGARRLDQLRKSIRKDAGKHLVKGKQFMKAKAPEKYMGAADGDDAE